MKKLIFALALALPFAGLARHADAKTNVATSIETLADITRQVGGDTVSVTALGKGNQDPHFVDARPNLLIALNKADLVVYVGLELEKGWLPLLINQARNSKIQSGAGNLDISATAGIDIAERSAATRAQGDIHPQGNPHFWLPPENARKIARAIAARLQQIDPGSAKKVQANLKAFEDKLTKKQAEWAKVAAPLKGVKVVSYHRSWSYLIKWLGLVPVGEVEPKPGVPPSASHLAELIIGMKQQGAKIVMVESFYSKNTSQTVADKAGAKLVVLPSDVGASSGIKDYFSLIDAVLADLNAGVK
jgi:zinc/manganese transport system substrate-binding protein